MALPIQILPLSVRGVAAVAWRMRAEDWREVTAVVELEDPKIWAERIVPFSKFGAVVMWGGLATAALGAARLRPGVFEAWMFATPDWLQVAVATTRWARNVLAPALIKAGAHRVQCQSIADHHVAHAWLASFGLEREAELPGWGKGGETFIQFARVADHVHVRRGRTAPAASPAAAAAAASPAAGADAAG